MNDPNDFELLPVGLPKGDDLRGANGGGAGAPKNAKFDPQWAQRASTTLMESQGLKVVEMAPGVTAEDLRQKTGVALVF